MGVINEPIYDEDLVNLGYLNKVVTSVEKKQIVTTKNYGSQPTPPYHIDDTWTDSNEIYKCINERLTGSFVESDWQLVATDNTELNDFIDNTYSTDKLEIQAQIDNKIETYYTNSDPSTGWITSLEKEKHVGDYWYNSTDNTQWRWSKNTSTTPITYDWNQVNVPMAVYDLIDKKKSIYTEKPTSYEKDDLWIIESTLSDSDLPIGTTENPIAKGDWVFATQNSDSYDKSHWQKKDEDISKTYLEDHYYNTTTLDTMFETVDSTTDSKILQSKDEIELEVSQTYTTKSETQTIVNDYDQQIGVVNETLITQSENISNISVETGRISTSVSSVQTNLSNNYMTTEQVNSQLGPINENATELRGKVTTLETNLDGVQINISTLAGTITNMAYSFTTDDLRIAKTSDPVNASLNNTGLKIYNLETLTAIFNNKGSGVDKLIVTGSAQIGYEKIVKGTKTINGSTVNVTQHYILSELIESLEDLE